MVRIGHLPAIFITGASGFIGLALINRLSTEQSRIFAACRNIQTALSLPDKVTKVVMQHLSGSNDHSNILKDMDIVIHLAARVHVMRETAADPLKEFRRVNTEGTARLARQAAAAGVRRFVFMSTIGVNGNSSGFGSFVEESESAPHNAYSRSKYEAEQALGQISRETGMELVVIRAPLVYGPGNSGNFMSLLRMVSKSVPLPLASVDNRRSLIYVGNLVDALAACVTHPAAAGKTFLASDGEDVSTPELIRRLASALDVKDRLFHFPPSLLRLAGRIAGKSAAVDSLLGSLAIDSSAIASELSWKPPFSMELGLRETAYWYKQRIMTDIP